MFRLFKISLILSVLLWNTDDLKSVEKSKKRKKKKKKKKRKKRKKKSLIIIFQKSNLLYYRHFIGQTHFWPTKLILQKLFENKAQKQNRQLVYD